LPNEPIWLTSEQVIGINVRLVQKTGEPHFLRDRGALESAVHRPVNKWHYEDEADVPNLAAHLPLGIGRNHPFEQGNKRTGFTAASIFLRLNGYSFVAPDGPLLGEFIYRIITRSLLETIFFDAWNKCIIPSDEWEEFKQRGEWPV
jgi:death on curing protein